MTKQEAIKYLKRIYPNGGGTWLDEQRIEAISMAVAALEEPVSEDLEEAAYKQIPEDKGYSTIIDKVVDYNSEKRRYWLMGAEWHKQQMMKDAIDYEIEGEKVKVIIINEDDKEDEK